jgi:GNAT superfamily N-acetyltransferase
MMTLQDLNTEDIDRIIPLIQELNPELSAPTIKKNQKEMFKLSNYRCFGLYKDNELIGLSSGWITIRHYCGKQIEIDNVIIASTHQSKGYGAQFIELLKQWSRKQNCKTMELNTYLDNARSHKFYFTQGFKILGFHFYKDL